MPSLTLEDLVFDYFLEKEAGKLSMVPRFWAHSELLSLIEDKVQFAVRPFGRKAHQTSGVVARRFLTTIIEEGGFSIKQNDFGGTMHQYQAQEYQQSVARMKAKADVVAEDDVGWDQLFKEKLA